jgi:polar amino acid transport system substrate-binding protein
MILALCSPVFFAPLCAQQALVISSVDNQLTLPLEQEILQQAYQRLGIEVSIIGLPSKRALRSANAGVTDGEAARIAAIAQEYPNLIKIAVPIRIDPMSLFVRAGDEFAVAGWESIPKDNILGYRRGIKVAENAIAEHGIDSYAGDNMKQLFEQLSRGRLDIVLTGPIGLEAILSDPQFEKIVQLDPPVQISYLYHFLHKKHAALVPEITRVLQEMEIEGKLQKIRQQFMTSTR